MKYKVTIEKLSESTHEYRQHDTITIYEQMVEELDIGALVDVVNRVNTYEDFSPLLIPPLDQSEYA